MTAHAAADLFFQGLLRMPQRGGNATVMATLSQDGVVLEPGNPKQTFASGHEELAHRQHRTALTAHLNHHALPWALGCPLLWHRPDGTPDTALPTLHIYHKHHTLTGVCLTPAARHHPHMHDFTLYLYHTAANPSLIRGLRVLPTLQGPYHPYLGVRADKRGKTGSFCAGSDRDAVLIDAAIAAPTTIWRGGYLPKTPRIVARVLDTRAHLDALIEEMPKQPGRDTLALIRQASTPAGS